MAKLVPNLDEINSLPTPLEPSERRLMDVLLETLDDAWTIYVQPHLNGLNPDIVIFSKDAGVGIFEVKEWDLANNYHIEGSGEDYYWEVYDGRQGFWVTLPYNSCPFRQVEKYKDSIYKFEIPLLDAEVDKDKSIYALITTFVYFSGYETSYLRSRFRSILGGNKKNKYVSVFGDDMLKPEKLRQEFGKHYLQEGSKFAKWMHNEEFEARLSSALAYPTYGGFDADLKNLTRRLSPKQRDLLPNEPGSRRVIGAAGSGKSLLLINKAVNAAREGGKALLVCFNITMANQLNDLVVRLARVYGPHVHRNIEVGHYHRLFPSEDDATQSGRYMSEKVDVLLIDEGQDFERHWVENLRSLCNDKHHFMFAEDDRQDLYLRAQNRKRKKLTVPGISGRPNLLNKSFRLPHEIAEFANYLIDWSKTNDEYDSGAIEIDNNRTGKFDIKTVDWFNGSYQAALGALVSDMKSMWNKGDLGSPADTAILICWIEDGWDIVDELNKLQIPLQTTFESRKEYQRLKKEMEATEGDFDKHLERRRRGYKCAFWMKTGKLKISTIHSFKGWELDRVLVLFNPHEEQSEISVRLLYTAITRTRNLVTIYNAAPNFKSFGDHAIERKLATAWKPS